MAFLDNSGDIILDAVLTDVGRKRMAAGNFRITKFTLGDDEIDYSLYNKDHHLVPLTTIWRFYKHRSLKRLPSKMLQLIMVLCLMLDKTYYTFPLLQLTKKPSTQESHLVLQARTSSSWLITQKQTLPAYQQAKS